MTTTARTAPAAGESHAPAPEGWRHPGTGAALVLSAVTAAVGAVVLSVQFGWPDVLDERAATALPAFAAESGWIRFGFLLELVSSVLLVPAAVGLSAALGSRSSVTARVLAVFGVAGALFQVMGWVRWPLVVPGLADRYLDPATDEQTRVAVGTTYDLLNAYGGGALGEHLGWLFQAPWAVGVAVLAVAASGVPRWFGWIGLLSAAAWALLIVPEPYLDVLSGDAVSFWAFNVYTVWFVWLGALGVLLATRRVAPAPAADPGPRR